MQRSNDFARLCSRTIAGHTLAAGAVLAMLSAAGTVADAQPALRRPAAGQRVIAADFGLTGGHLGPLLLHSGSQSISMPQAFTVTLGDGRELKASDFLVLRGPKHTPERTCVVLADATTGLGATDCLVQPAGAHYVRQTLELTAASHDVPIAEVRLLEATVSGAHVVGTVSGSPAVAGNWYFGFEHPLSKTTVEDGVVRAFIARTLPLRAGTSVTYSSVAGVAAPGQMRRDFLAYIERERPRPYAPFLHYNSWFDLGYTNRFDEAGALDRIHAYGTELVEKRRVRLDSFLFDDGWDDPNTLWEFDSGFPHGFTATSAAAAKYRAGIGVWLSPWGGYAEQKDQRIAYGRAHGYEIVDDGYALSGPRYFQAFEARCLDMIDRYRVNGFKFDGTGNADHVFPGSLFDSDFEAAIALVTRLRKEEPKLFVNISTGTFASPFWLRYADAIWRGGDDSDFTGVGTWRQKWITYRDAQTYKNIVQAGPLFPLNSLMLHGLIWAKSAEHLDTDPGHDFSAEVWSYFGGGTQLQEMYITPSLLAKEDWDTLAAAAEWSRANQDILRDTHWIGGDPEKLEVYGWAAWSPKKSIIVLRNPSDKPQKYSLKPADALELPPGAPRNYSVKQIFGATPAAASLRSADTRTLALGPYEVRVLELLPALR